MKKRGKKQMETYSPTFCFKKMNKKGQASMEFLMTYGWAILVVLIAIGALSYLGVFDYSRFLPERCILPAGFSCDDFKVSAETAPGESNGSIELVIRNGMGADLLLINVSVNGCNLGNSSMLEGKQLKFSNFECSTGPKDKKFKQEIIITYQKIISNIKYTKTGEIITRIDSHIYRETPEEDCNNEIWNFGEECDGGLGCNSSCQCKTDYVVTTPPSVDCTQCGNGQWDSPAEECDGESIRCNSNCLCKRGFHPTGTGSCDIDPDELPIHNIIPVQG